MKIYRLRRTSGGRCAPCGCIGGPCVLELVCVDENRCEDDAFEVWLVLPATGVERRLGEIDMVSSPPGCCGQDENGNPCPQTERRLGFTVAPGEVNACCRLQLEMRVVRENCCSTWMRVSVRNADGDEAFSEYFGQGGTITLDITALCSPAP